MNISVKSFIELYRIFRRYYYDYQSSRNSPIKIFNYQIHDSNYGVGINKSLESHWLFQFIVHRDYLKDKNRQLSIFGTNGDKLAIYLNKSDFKIFYTIENVHVKLSPWYQYEGLLIDNQKIDLSLGFDYINHEKYLRVPFWLMNKFKPNDTFKMIKQKCEEINNLKVNIKSRSKFCAFICREDYFGDRKFFAEEVKKVGYINFPGKFMHNDDDLLNKFSDSKINYLNQFKFNLCPENSNNSGYVTEKIFDSIWAGCIPIYWGSENKPEPDIINHNSVFFLNLDKSNSNILEEIKNINDNPKLYNEFANQNRLTKEAPEYIYEYYLKLDTKIKEIIK